VKRSAEVQIIGKISDPGPIVSGIDFTIKRRKIRGRVFVSVHIVGEKEAAFLNRKYRKKIYTPEVLSFPIEHTLPLKPYTSIPILLGDIFLCLPVIQKRARSSGHTVSSELQFLASHATDHLLGIHH
jgi:probable rRNA maturation factor